MKVNKSIYFFNIQSQYKNLYLNNLLNLGNIIYILFNKINILSYYYNYIKTRKPIFNKQI